MQVRGVKASLQGRAIKQGGSMYTLGINSGSKDTARSPSSVAFAGSGLMASYPCSDMGAGLSYQLT